MAAGIKGQRPGKSQEKRHWMPMNVYFERKDKAILSIFLQTASYLSNLLNDMYTYRREDAPFFRKHHKGNPYES